MTMHLAAAQLAVVPPGSRDARIDLEDDDDNHRARLQRHAILAAGYDEFIERWARRATERLRRSR